MPRLMSDTIMSMPNNATEAVGSGIVALSNTCPGAVVANPYRYIYTVRHLANASVQTWQAVESLVAGTLPQHGGLSRCHCHTNHILASGDASSLLFEFVSFRW